MGMVTIIVFISILALAAVVALVVGGGQSKHDRALSVIAGTSGGKNDDGKDKTLAKHKADIAKKLKQVGDQVAEKKKDKTTIRQLMIEAGLEPSLSKYWTFALVFSVIVWILLSVVTSWPQIAVILLTFTAFVGAPRWFLRKKAERRQRKFLEEFADALDASVRLLQAGMPISEAISMVAREFTGPLREEMTRMYENQKIGVPLGAAALEMAHRIPLTEAHMFATALQIQSETGSSLSEVLSNLSAVIRARFRLKRKVKALSSEAKASAAIIAALPILVSLGLYLVNEKYVGILFHTTKGNFMLGGAVFWMLCGVLIMKQMINFKV